MKNNTKDAVASGFIGLAFTLVGAFGSVFASYAAQKMIQNAEEKKVKKGQEQNGDSLPDVLING